MVRLHRLLGRRGWRSDNQRFFNKCADCGRIEKLTGFLCKKCYSNRLRRYSYHTDSEARKKCIERSSRTRQRNKVK